MKRLLTILTILVLPAISRGDDTLTLQQALARSDYVILDPKTYWVCDLQIDSNKTITGSAGSTVIRSSCPVLSGKNLFDIRGSLGDSFTMDSFSGYTITINNSNTGIEAEEAIFLTETDWAEFHRVRSISVLGGVTTIQLYSKIQFPFTLGIAKVQRGTWKKNITIQNITFEGAQIVSLKTTERYEDHAVGAMMAYNVNVLNNRFKHIGSRAIMFIYFVANSKMIGNTAESAYDRTYETHTRTSNNVISNNIAIAGLYGVSCQGIGTVCTGNRSTGQHGYDANDTEHGGGMYLASAYNAIMTGNSVDASWDNCMFIANGYKSLVANNMFSKCGNHGISLSSSNYIHITGNSILDFGSVDGDAGIYFYDGSNHISIDSNRILAPVYDGVLRRGVADSGVVPPYVTVGLNFFFNFPSKEINLTTTGSGSDTLTERLAVGSPLTIYDGDAYRYSGADWVPGRMEVWGLAKAKGQLFTQTSAPTLQNGECTMSLTSNTNVKVTCKGSDATIRNADITIAP